jgi:N-acetylgalactosamine kinase
MTIPEDLSPLADAFGKEFGRAPRWLIRAPGRINLIGEHTDYNGFPCMPMAIDRAIRVAAAPRENGVVEVRDVARTLYPPVQFAVAREIPAGAPGEWANYVRAGVQGMVELAAAEGRDAPDLHGMSCLVHGDIPPAAGLSSSTALVVASGLAFSAVNGLSCGRHDMADRMARAEHYVGTQGGGMDQAVCLLGREGEVLKVDFFPLRIAHVPFPREYCIVAAHSTVQSRKTGEQKLAYNRRVLECRVSADLLARRLGEEPPERLADLVTGSGHKPEDLLRILERMLQGRDSLGLRRAATLFGIDPGRFVRRYLRMKDGRLLPMPGDGLRVLQRCRHVFSEAARVEQAVSCLKTLDMTGLGRLMDESHRSCAADYEVSCYELDQLVDVMRGAGALGARLTGAGFGGFAIGLVASEEAGRLSRELEELFYVPRHTAMAGNVFVFRPEEGAVEEPAA